jgi:hypothetical protein
MTTGHSTGEAAICSQITTLLLRQIIFICYDLASRVDKVVSLPYCKLNEADSSLQHDCDDGSPTSTLIGNNHLPISLAGAGSHAATDAGDGTLQCSMPAAD